MMRSLYSGVAGLKTHQTKMDVIGNNIANVNTVAYKSSSVTFTDLLYQTTQNATGANAATGRAGINAKQIGLGVTTGAISTSISTSGAAQTTGNPFDIRISGSSFFVVSDGANQYYTRSGAFTVDANGTLCMSANGYTVQGYGTMKDTDGNLVIDTGSLKSLQVMSTENMTSDPVATTKAYMTGIIDSNSDSLSTAAGQVVSVPFYDNLGYSYTAQFKIEKDTTAGDFKLTMTDVLDSDGKSILKDASGVELTSANKITECAAAMAQNTAIKFDTDQTTTTPTGKITTPAIDATTGMANIDIDMSELNGYATGFTNMKIAMDVATVKNIDNKGTSTINGGKGETDSTAGEGCKVGDLSGISIGQDGKITGTYTNGQTKLLGQIAVASFANASGLEKEGDNLYASTLNSGDAVIGDISADGGSMTTGELEMSNVDLSSEFTDMITTQRGFQANSRIITVSDTMLEELVNLKR